VRSFRISAAILMVLVLALAATGCSRSTKESEGSGLSPAQRAVAASGESSTTSDTAAEKASSPGATSSAGGSSASGSASGSTSGGNGSSTGATKPVSTGMPVMVIFWDDTSSKSLSGAEIVIGASSFRPSSSAKNSRKNLGPFAYGKKIDLIVYPDGRGGKKIVVPMVLDRQMIPKSEQDAIHVAISDKTVRVLGNAILNVDQSYPRF